MSAPSYRSRSLPILALALLALLALLACGCPGNTPLRLDGKRYRDGGPTPDTYINLVDTRPWPDQPVLKKDTRPPWDTWPWKQDTYVGTPFGCQVDSDCFGQLCCPTPWGVQLCAPTCDL